MALQFDTALRNAWLDLYESNIGTAPVLEIRTGAQPANCAAADSGTLLRAITLPSDWMAAASGGSISKTGTWTDSSTGAAGTAGHYRLKTSGGTCKEQGSITATGGGGDMTLDNTSIATGQQITINTWTRTAPGA